MTPGVVNGVRVVWPEGGQTLKQPEPEEKPCLFGHIAGRYANNRCKECQRAQMRRRRLAAKRATKEPA